jgi:hypothetical protein
MFALLITHTQHRIYESLEIQMAKNLFHLSLAIQNNYSQKHGLNAC